MERHGKRNTENTTVPGLIACFSTHTKRTTEATTTDNRVLRTLQRSSTNYKPHMAVEHKQQKQKPRLMMTRNPHLSSLPVVLVLAGEIHVLEPVEGLADAFAGLGEHGLHRKAWGVRWSKNEKGKNEKGSNEAARINCASAGMATGRPQQLLQQQQ